MEPRPRQSHILFNENLISLTPAIPASRALKHLPPTIHTTSHETSNLVASLKFSSERSMNGGVVSL